MLQMGAGAIGADAGRQELDRRDERGADEVAVEAPNLDMDYDRGVFGWDGVLDTVSVLARNQQTDVQVNTLTGGVKMSKMTDYRRRLWERQAEALGAPQYRVTVRGRCSQDGKTINLCKHRAGETLWTADEVSAQIPALEVWNARGYDIYLTPIDDRQHHVLLDDLTADGVEFVKQNYNPCIICSSSEGNWQAVIRVPKMEKSSAEQSAGNLLMQRLNHLPDGCGGDKQISAVVHPFRMTGFRNKKPERNDFQSKIADWAPGQCERATALLDEIRSNSTTKNQLARETFVNSSGQGEIPETVRYEDEMEIGDEKAFREYAREWNRAKGLHQQHPEWGQPDMSRWDYRASKHLLQQGFSERTVQKAIRRCSPNVGFRHADVIRYALHTVANAVAELLREMEHDMERM